MRLGALLTLFCFGISSCSILNNKNVIKVKLAMKEGLSPELGRTSISNLLIPPDSTTANTAQRLGVKTYTISNYIFNPAQFWFQQLKSGKINQDEYMSHVNRRMIDTNGIAREPFLDADVVFFTGRKFSGELIVVADENNNNRFDDRTIMIAEDTKDASAKQIHNMPKVHLSNMPVLLNGSIVQTSSMFFINTNSLYLNNNDTGYQSQAVPINLVTAEYKVGRFKYRGNKYKIGLREMFPWQKAEKKNAIVKVANNREDSIFLRKWNTRPAYKKGDIVTLKNGAAEITDINYLKGLITLTSTEQKASRSYLMQNSEPVENAVFTIGDKYPEFSATVDSMIPVEHIRGKVVLLNFWFAACPPCIAEFDGLNQLYTQLKDSSDFAFVSLTFENQEVVEQFKKKYNLQFPIFTISVEECSKLMANPLYPTNIVLDKNRIVKYYSVGGKTNKEEAGKYILTDVKSAIQEEL